MMKMIFSHLSGMYFWVLGPIMEPMKIPTSSIPIRPQSMPALATVMYPAMLVSMLMNTAMAEVPGHHVHGCPDKGCQVGHVEETAAHADEGGDGRDHKTSHKGPDGVEAEIRPRKR